MKLSKLILAMGLAVSVVGGAQAAPTVLGGISKKITMTAVINDAIFVSKPDGSTWYGVEEMNADDYKQKHFSKVLPVRIWSKNSDLNVSLSQPLKMSNGYYEMLNPTVGFTTAKGLLDLKFGTAQKLTQVVQSEGSYDEIHNLQIGIDAPVQSGALSTNGSYSGDLVMLFEPFASAP